VAHKKAGASKAHQGCDVKGKRLGIKIPAGGQVRPGTVILKQRGTVYKPGLNTGIGKDYSIYAKIEGTVNFRTATGKKRGRKIVTIEPLPNS
jgi:large subunit ribosomal protein L27